MRRFLAPVMGIGLLFVFVVGAAIPARAERVSLDQARYYNPLLVENASYPMFQQDGISIENARFSDPLDIDNPYFPLEPETTFIYRGRSDGSPTYERFAVTERTKTIMGVETRVVRDANWEDGELVEVTFDWFAQDDAGNVWYFGEFVTDYENGKVIGHEGSWKAGVNGATPGIVMKARPRVGDTYRQENAPGVAEDMATVLSLDESICVPYDCFWNVLKTEDFTPLEPDFVENKFYARGIGLIKTVLVEGGPEVSRLVNIVTDDDDDD